MGYAVRQPEEKLLLSGRDVKENPLNRCTVSSRFKFTYNGDGSLDLSIQKDSPGKDREPNWLSAPAGTFILILRLYWPKESMLDGSWKPLAVKRTQ